MRRDCVCVYYSKDPMSKTTDFGYREVPVDDKSRLVADVFDSVASQYDLMNDVMSAGIHRIWKRFALSVADVRAGAQVLDLAGGSGDLAIKLAHRVSPGGRVVLADINASMLARGRDRVIDAGAVEIVEYAQVNAEKLPFQDCSFDYVFMAFGLRNVTDKQAALREIKRVLSYGGQLLVLEFSRPVIHVLQTLYDMYSFKVIPKLGELVANDRASYEYLVESIRRHPDQEALCTMLRSIGYESVTYHNLTGGIVALHRGFKF